MIRYLKIAALLAFLLSTVWFFSRSAASEAALANEEVSPRSLYIQNCAQCHGSNGRAQTAKGRKLEAADLTGADVQGMSTARIVRAITNGRVGMPSFKKKLSRQQIAQIAAYVHSF
jgi:cytochrome c6